MKGKLTDIFTGEYDNYVRRKNILICDIVIFKDRFAWQITDSEKQSFLRSFKTLCR